MYDIVCHNPLFGPLHQKSWKYSLILEEAGILSPKKGQYIREKHLTVSFDKESASYVDLLYPNQPRPIVKKANLHYLAEMAWLKMYIETEGVHSKETQILNENLLQNPLVEIITNRLGKLDTTNLELIVYGHSNADTTSSSNSIMITEPGKEICAVPPCLFGLRFRLLERYAKIWLPGYDQRYLLCWPLVSAIFQFICDETHSENYHLNETIREYAEKQNADLMDLSKRFILGEVDPFFDMLDRAVTPVGSGLILFMSHLYRSDSSPITISRIEAIRKVSRLTS